MSTHPENEENPAESDEADSPMQGPHNRFVLGYWSSPPEARGMLDVQLPDSLKKILRLDLLTVENSHFVDEMMAEVESDLLFRIPRADREGEDIYVYVLWEHQRNRDSLMVLRMWVYLGMIYRHLANEGRLLPGAKLPFVYPIVLFQGTGGWKKGLILEDLIDLEGIDEELHRWVPKFEIDLIRLDEDSPRIRPDDPVARLGLSLMRAVMVQNVKKWLEENIEELNQIYAENRNLMVLILTYSLVSGADLTKEDFLSIVTDKGSSKMKYEAGSVAEQLVAEGRTEGKIDGKNEEKREIALKMIKTKMTDQEISDLTDLPLNTIAELRLKSED